MVRFASSASHGHVQSEHQLTASRRGLLHLWVRRRRLLYELHTDSPRPVIIAENMIGCAMYELVGAATLLPQAAVDVSRSVWVTTVLWERSFGLKPTRPPSRSMRRLVHPIHVP